MRFMPHTDSDVASMLETIGAKHLDDLIAEMDSMSGGADRCRWPLDQPYPVRH